jgi:hypothetical protein
MRKTFAVCLLAAVAAHTAAHAQSAGSIGAYLALNGTPIAALPPVMTSTILTSLQRTVQFAGRYGYLDNDAYSTNGQAANNGGVTVVLPSGLGTTISLTGGVWYPTGKQYSAHLMLGAAGDYGIGSAQLTDAADSPLLSLAVDGELGFGKPSRGTYWAWRLGAPVTLGQRGDGIRIALFATPGMAYGWARVDGVNAGGQPVTTTQSGLRFMTSGGVGVYTPASTLSVSLGFQHVYITGASTLVGLVVSLAAK